MVKQRNGKATITKNGDVTNIRIVDYHGQPPLPPMPNADPNTPEINKDLNNLKHVDIIAFCQTAEQEFLKLLEHLLNEMPDGVPVIGLRAETAYKLNISTATAKRYIEKYCFALSSPYRIMDGRIVRKLSPSTKKGD